MKPEQVPPTPFVAYRDGTDWTVDEVIVLEYGLSSPDCTVKTFLAQVHTGATYRTSIDNYYLTKEEVVEQMRIDIFGSIEALQMDMQETINEIGDLRAAYRRLS